MADADPSTHDAGQMPPDHARGNETQQDGNEPQRTAPDPPAEPQRTMPPPVEPQSTAPDPPAEPQRTMPPPVEPQSTAPDPPAEPQGTTPPPAESQSTAPDPPAEPQGTTPPPAEPQGTASDTPADTSTQTTTQDAQAEQQCRTETPAPEAGVATQIATPTTSLVRKKSAQKTHRDEGTDKVRKKAADRQRATLAANLIKRHEAMVNRSALPRNATESYHDENDIYRRVLLKQDLLDQAIDSRVDLQKAFKRDKPGRWRSTAVLDYLADLVAFAKLHKIDIALEEEVSADGEPPQTSRYVDASTQTGDWISRAIEAAARKDTPSIANVINYTNQFNEWAIEDVRSFYMPKPTGYYKALSPLPQETEQNHKRRGDDADDDRPTTDDRPTKRINLDEIELNVDKFLDEERDAWFAEPATASERNADDRFPLSLPDKYGKAWPILKKMYEAKIAQYKTQGIEKTMDDIDAEENRDDT